MSERVQLPSERGLGLDMPDGTKYNADRRRPGYVTVSDEHAAMLRAGSALDVGEKFAIPGAPGVTCSACDFQQYAALAGPLCKCGGEWLPPVHSEPPVDTRRVKVYDIIG